MVSSSSDTVVFILFLVPGRRGALRLPTPLRTGLESFPSSGSSTPKSLPCWDTRPLELPHGLYVTDQQSSARRQRAHQLILRLPSIAFPLEKDSPDFYVMEHQHRTSAPFRAGVMSESSPQPVSAPLPDGIRFFQPLNPAPPTACLAVSPAPMLRGDCTGFPRSTFSS